MKIEIATGFMFGVACAVVGFPYYTWQFWLLLLAAAVWKFLPREARK